MLLAGPEIDWKPGRSDKIDHAACPEDGRLPDGAKGAPHIRDIFYRMGFNDQEIVALSGGHTCNSVFGVYSCMLYQGTRASVLTY